MARAHRQTRDRKAGWSSTRSRSRRTTAAHRVPFPRRFDPGEWIGLSGASERVTTSLVDAVFGLNAPKSGTIELDGHDVRDLALTDVRSRVTLVRGTEILPGCIADNLHAANPELSR